MSFLDLFFFEGVLPDNLAAAPLVLEPSATGLAEGVDLMGLMHNQIVTTTKMTTAAMITWFFHLGGLKSLKLQAIGLFLSLGKRGFCKIMSMRAQAHYLKWITFWRHLTFELSWTKRHKALVPWSESTFSSCITIVAHVTYRSNSIQWASTCQTNVRFCPCEVQASTPILQAHSKECSWTAIVPTYTSSCCSLRGLCKLFAVGSTQVVVRLPGENLSAMPKANKLNKEVISWLRGTVVPG